MRRRILALSLALLAVALTACGTRASAPVDSASLSMDIQDGVWPENEFTAAIPRPESGTVESGWITESYCALTLSGVDDGAFGDYLDALTAAGFTEAASNAEELQLGISGNALYTSGGTGVSLSHQAGTLVLCITLGE